MSRIRTTWVRKTLLFSCLLMLAGPGLQGQDSFFRGMTVSCPMYGQIWGSELMAETLEELAEIGVEWISIHPYAGVRKDGQIRHQPAAETGYLARAVEMAGDSGLELFWKPHLAYWGSFEWRGDIEFGEHEDQWRRFFADYRRFIVDQARFAEASRIRLFAVGVELEATTHREEWREIIAAVRAVYSGRIVYAANWDSLEKVPFWDLVDLIGVQAYYPLSDDEKPTRARLAAGWQQPLEALRLVSEKFDRRVVFAEIGYDVSEAAAKEPWAVSLQSTAQGELLQRRLIEVALDQLEDVPFIAGMFWWKWMPGSRSERDFAMHRPEVRAILGRAWAAD